MSLGSRSLRHPSDSRSVLEPNQRSREISSEMDVQDSYGHDIEPE
jgi:hypothetical protein